MWRRTQILLSAWPHSAIAWLGPPAHTQAQHCEALRVLRGSRFELRVGEVTEERRRRSLRHFSPAQPQGWRLSLSRAHTVEAMLSPEKHQLCFTWSITNKVSMPKTIQGHAKSFFSLQSWVSPSALILQGLVTCTNPCLQGGRYAQILPVPSLPNSFSHSSISHGVWR